MRVNKEMVTDCIKNEKQFLLSSWGHNRDAILIILILKAVKGKRTLDIIFHHSFRE